MSATPKAKRAAMRRAAILTVAHVGNALDDDRVQSLVALWVAHGELTDGQWELITMLANQAMQPGGAGHPRESTANETKARRQQP